MKQLIYLEYRLLINSIKNVARSPKRLIPFLIVAAWVISSLMFPLLMMGDRSMSGGPSHGLTQNLGDIPIRAIQSIFFWLIALGTILTLHGAFNSGLMVFSIAQIDFLFPTPIPRKHVLLLKLAKDYLKYVGYVAMLYLFIMPIFFGTLGVSVMPTGILGIFALAFLIVTVINLAHTINVVFTFGFERLRTAALAIKVLPIGILPATAAFGVAAYVGSGDILTGLAAAAKSPIVRWILAPADWCASIMLAPLIGVTEKEMLWLGILATMSVVSFLMLYSRRENLYEPSLGISFKVASRKKAMREGDWYARAKELTLKERGVRRIPGAIPPFGNGAMAIVWKYLLIRWRTSRTRILLTIAGIVLFVYGATRFEEGLAMIASLQAALIYVITFMAANVQTEVRAELRHADITKPMPIAPWKMMLAQMAGSAVYLNVFVIVYMVAVLVFAPSLYNERIIWLGLASPSLVFAISGASITPVLVYPDTRDIAQNMLRNLISVPFFLIALGPSVVLAVILLRVLELSVAYALGVIMLTNLLLGAALVVLNGYLFGRYDPTSQ